MSDLLQSGYHPDADQLNAFVERALPDHERQQTLAHLAICRDCRAIVALTLPPVEESAAKPFRRPWFTGWHLAWPAVAALAGLVVFFVHLRNVAIDRKSADASGQVAISHPPASLQAPANPEVSTPKPAPVVSEKRPPTGLRDENAVGGVISNNAKPATDGKSLEAFPMQNRNVVGLAQGGPIPGGTSLHGQLRPQAGNASGVGVDGTKTPAVAADHFVQPPAVTNAATATAPNPLIESQSLAGLSQQAPLPPLPVPAPQAAPVKTVNGAATDQTVEVAAAPIANLSTLNAEVALPSIGNTVLQHALPSNLPVLSIVSNAHRVLAIDIRNEVFFSDDDGTTWNAIPARWRGRAVKVVLSSSGKDGTSVSHGRVANFGATSSAPVSSQTSAIPGTGATLIGTVTDQSGAVIPDASVVVGKAATPNLRSVKTDRTGHYLIDDLVPDNYQVEVEASGFVKQQLDVTLTASQQSLANFILTVGGAAQTVTVEASAEPIATLSVAKKKDAARSSVNQPQAVFEMTTDTGDHWTSTDGHTWKHQ